MTLTQPLRFAGLQTFQLNASSQFVRSLPVSKQPALIQRFPDQRCLGWLQRNPIAPIKIRRFSSSGHTANLRAHQFNWSEFEEMPDKVGYPTAVPPPCKLLQSMSPFARICMQKDFLNKKVLGSSKTVETMDLLADATSDMFGLGTLDDSATLSANSEFKIP